MPLTVTNTFWRTIQGDNDRTKQCSKKWKMFRVNKFVLIKLSSPSELVSSLVYL